MYQISPVLSSPLKTHTLQLSCKIIALTFSFTFLYVYKYHLCFTFINQNEAKKLKNGGKFISICKKGGYHLFADQNLQQFSKAKIENREF